MDHIALISDIHGNMTALQTTLDDIRSRGVKRIFCLGDLVGKGPDSAQAVDVCREVCEATVRGNWDDFILHETDNPVLQWHRERLGEVRLAYLASLPNVIEFLMSGKRVRLFHASQIGIYHRVHMSSAREELAAMFTNTPFTGSAPEPDVVGYGDIHGAYSVSFRQKTLFNVGSVGNPLDMTQASYVILEGAYGSAEVSPLSIQFVRLPYDIELAIRQAEAAAMPDLQAYASELRTARYRGAVSAT